MNGVAGTYARIAELPLEIEGYRLERLEAPVTRDLTRVTTLVRLEGSGEEGLGEDVTWYAEAHDREQAAGPILPLGGSWTLESFSSALRIDEPHKRWAYESAALDLALRQAGRSLANAVGRTPRPVTFLVSPGLGDPRAVPDQDCRGSERAARASVAVADLRARERVSCARRRSGAACGMSAGRECRSLWVGLSRFDFLTADHRVVGPGSRGVRTSREDWSACFWAFALDICARHRDT